MNPNFHKATAISVFDGDTLRLNIDLGFNVTLSNVLFHLAGINAPEVRGLTKDAGRRAQTALKEQTKGANLLIEVTNRELDKIHGQLWVEIDGNWQSVNQWLVDQGFAVHA